MEHKEVKRLSELCSYEDSLFLEGYDRIAGIDEAGRGALAGPMVAAAVILKRKYIKISGIDDSKKILPKKRKEIFKTIIRKCMCWSVGKVSPLEIDTLGINRANVLVMERAVENLKFRPDILLIDAISIKSGYEMVPIINGDEKSISIAAASIIAKVVRDEIMVNLSKSYPDYRFDLHKGYGTEYHMKLLEKHGPSREHRKTYRGVLN